ncbi:MAG: polysaccharide deacetylase family protein [Bdellovibrionaceae bacterium]|nr:polysaccharide deacetylase family protein [Pseudobdellovibrionaceae bacterium]
MRTLLFFSLSPLVMLWGCVSTPEHKEPLALGAGQPLRSLASLPSTEDIARSTKASLGLPDPQPVVEAQLKRYLRVFYHTQSLLNDFDRMLEEKARQKPSADGNVLADETYAKLVSAWILSDQEKERFVQSYLTLAQWEADLRSAPAAGRELERARVEMMAKALRQSLDRAGTDRIALQGLYQKIHEEAEESVMNEPSMADSQARAIGQLAWDRQFNAKDSATAFYKKHGSELQMAAVQAAADREVQREVANLLTAVKEEILANLMSREPQSAGQIMASSGASGNINGQGFPMGTWALTYDDGPSGNFTMKLVQDLSRNRMKATFFWLAKLAPRLQGVVNNVKAAGMDLASHSFSHRNLQSLNAGGLQQEIVNSTRILAQSYGAPPRLFRCPYGACGQAGGRIRQLIADQKMVHVFWNVDSLDWQDRNPQSVYARVKRQMAAQGRGIVLFHDIHAQSVTVTNRLLADLQKDAAAGRIRVVSVQQAIDQVNASTR